MQSGVGEEKARVSRSDESERRCEEDPGAAGVRWAAARRDASVAVIRTDRARLRARGRRARRRRGERGSRHRAPTRRCSREQKACRKRAVSRSTREAEEVTHVVEGALPLGEVALGLAVPEPVLVPVLVPEVEAPEAPEAPEVVAPAAAAVSDAVADADGVREGTEVICTPSDDTVSLATHLGT
jgi:hypothetical protein